MAYFFVKFSKFIVFYFLPGDKLIEFWQQYKLGSRRSIKREEFLEHATLINEGAYPRIDYLKVVEELFL